MGEGTIDGGSLNSSAGDVSDVDTIHTNGNRKTRPPAAMIAVRSQTAARDSVAIVDPPLLGPELHDSEAEDDREQHPAHRRRLAHQAVLEGVLDDLLHDHGRGAGRPTLGHDPDLVEDLER